MMGGYAYSMMSGYTYNSSRSGTQAHIYPQDLVAACKNYVCTTELVSPARLSCGMRESGQCSHHCLLPNTPRISWCVNWLSDKWRCGGCLFWLVTWGAGVAKEILVFQNMSQFMFTLTSLGAMLLSTQTQKPNGNNFDQTISSCMRFWSVRLLLNCTLPSFPHPLTNKRLKPRTGLSHAHLFLALSLDTYCHY